MKRLLSIILVVMLLSACGSPKVNDNMGVEPLPIGYDFTQITPDPTWLFTNTIQVYDQLDGDKYGFYIKDVTDRSVYDTYVKACADKFPVIKYNIDSGAAGNSYQAKTADQRYKIDVYYITSGQYVMVTVTRRDI